MARNLPTFGQRRHSSLPSLIHAECEVTMQEEQACSIYSSGDQTDTLDHGQRPEYAFDRKLISSTTSCKYVTVLFIERGLCLSPLELLYFSRTLDGVHDYMLWWWNTHMQLQHGHGDSAWIRFSSRNHTFLYWRILFLATPLLLARSLGLVCLCHACMLNNSFLFASAERR